MKRKNIIPSLLSTIIFLSLAILIAVICNGDATASVMIGFMAFASLIETVDGIRTNVHIHRSYKNRTGGIIYKHDVYQAK